MEKPLLRVPAKIGRIASEGSRSVRRMIHLGQSPASDQRMIACASKPSFRGKKGGVVCRKNGHSEGFTIQACPEWRNLEKDCGQVPEWRKGAWSTIVGLVNMNRQTSLCKHSQGGCLSPNHQVRQSRAYHQASHPNHTSLSRQHVAQHPQVRLPLRLPHRPLGSPDATQHVLPEYRESLRVREVVHDQGRSEGHRRAQESYFGRSCVSSSGLRILYELE